MSWRRDPLLQTHVRYMNHGLLMGMFQLMKSITCNLIHVRNINLVLRILQHHLDTEDDLAFVHAMHIALQGQSIGHQLLVARCAPGVVAVIWIVCVHAANIFDIQSWNKEVTVRVEASGRIHAT